MGKANAGMVEFKLASNTSLEKNLCNQVAIYEKASDTKRSLKVILYSSNSELDKALRIHKALGLGGNPDIILIDANRENKPSASKADSAGGA